MCTTGTKACSDLYSLTKHHDSIHNINHTAAAVLGEDAERTQHAGARLAFHSQGKEVCVGVWVFVVCERVCVCVCVCVCAQRDTAATPVTIGGSVGELLLWQQCQCNNSLATV
jgi:hypothetical protein